MNRYSKGRQIWGIIYPPVLYLVIQTAATFLAMIVISIAYMLAGGNTGRGSADVELFLMNHTLEITMFGCLVGIPIFGAIFKHDRKYEREICGISYTQTDKGNYILIVILAVAAASGLNIVASVGASFLPESMLDSYEDVSVALSAGSIWLQLLTAGVCAPVVEELIFRGLVYKRLRNMTNVKISVFLSALAFGIYHGNLIQGVYAFLIGLLLAYVYEKYQSLWAPIILHAVANTSAVSMEQVYGHMSDLTILLFMVAMLALAGYILKVIQSNVHVKKIVAEKEEYQW